MEPFLLTIGLTVAVMGSDPTDTAMKPEALRAIGRSCYKIYGIKDKIKRYEKKYLPKEVKEYGAHLALGYTIAIEKRISLQWTF